MKVKSMLLYGRVSVRERLKANPASINKVFLQEKLSLPVIEELSKRNGIALERLSSGELNNLKPGKGLQGVVARVEKFKYTPFEGLLEAAKKTRPAIIFLDRINDPQNLGSIIRSAACFGGFALVIPQFNACGVTEAVLHVASGGENYLPVAMVANISAAIIKAKRCGYWIIGADAQSGASSALEQAKFSLPLGLVLGSEGAGIRYGVQKHLDFKMRIPMRGAKLSFNVGIACAIFCYEIAKQRKGLDAS